MATYVPGNGFSRVNISTEFHEQSFPKIVTKITTTNDVNTFLTVNVRKAKLLIPVAVRFNFVTNYEIRLFCCSYNSRVKVTNFFLFKFVFGVFNYYILEHPSRVHV